MSIGRLYRVLVPAGSRRDRALWLGWLAVRKLRDGPLPWLRAVRAGTFQLLPPRAQRALLRLGGRLPRAGGAAAPASAAIAPGAGVEVPGLVSVVLPVYRQANLLGDAVRSVLAQDHRELELIVVDDGSGPDVQEVLQPWLADPRVRVLRQENRGLPRALDTGFAVARGELWTWTSADNVLLPRMVSTLVAALRARPAVGMVYADYELIDDDGVPVRGTEFRVQSRRGPEDPVVRLPRDAVNLAVVQDNFVGPCFLYRGAVGRLLGMHHPEMGLEDYDYWLRVQRCFGLQHLGTDDVLYRYRVHRGSLSARAKELRLWERGRALLAEERQRAAWHRDPPRVLADDAARAWLASGGVDVAALRAPCEADLRDGRKTLVVVAARGAAAAVPGTPAPALPPLPPHAVAAVVCTDVRGAYDAAELLVRDDVAALASDAAVAARAAVFSRRVFAPGPDGEPLAPLLPFCSERTWQRRRWSVPAPAPGSPVPVTARPLRLLVQVDAFTHGGLERVVLDLLHGLRARGVTAALLVLGERGAAVEECIALGVPVLDAAHAASATAYGELLREGGYDCVHAHDSVRHANVAAGLGVPFVQVLHNAYAWFPPERRAAYRAADAHTAAYVAVSVQALAYADLQLGLDAGKAVVVTNGIAPARALPQELDRAAARARLGVAPDAFAFVQVAAVQPTKAQRVAVRALARLRELGVPATVLFAGRATDAWYARAAAADAERLGVAAHARFLGQRDDVAELLAVADAFVLPSLVEGCSLAVWEAVQAGLPLVLADVGAAREQLRHGRGVLVAPPFASVLDLDAATLPRVLHDEHADYAERLADAMARVARGDLDGGDASRANAWAWSRDRMVDAHHRLCAFVAQGGAPAAVRSWMHASSPAR